MADYWMKLYIEILDDPKMATMPDRAWRRTIELFLVAKKLNKDGHLPDVRQIAWLLRMNADDLQHDLAQIASTGIIEQEVGGWYIPKFVQRQAAVPDAERKAQERDRKKSQQYYADVTNASRNVTQRTEDRDTEYREQRTEAKTEAEAEKQPADPFDEIHSTLKASGIIPAGANDIKAINEILAAGAIIDDVKNGIAWKVANNDGKAIRYVSQIVGPTKTAMAKRLQSFREPTGENSPKKKTTGTWQEVNGQRVFVEAA